MQNRHDFVDDDLDSDQEPGAVSQYDDVTIDTIVGETGECERAAGPDVENGAIERLDDAAAECPASV